MEVENLNKPQEQQCNIHDVSNCPDLTNVWYKILEEHADDIPTRYKFCDALWMLEAGGFVQLKFALQWLLLTVSITDVGDLTEKLNKIVEYEKTE